MCLNFFRSVGLRRALDILMFIKLNHAVENPEQIRGYFEQKFCSHRFSKIFNANLSF